MKMKKLIILFLVTSINIAFLTTYAQDCNPATITKVEKEGAGNRINWTMPPGDKEIIITQGEDFNGNPVGDKSSFSVFHRFTPDDLITVNAGTLTQVVFAPTKLPWQPEPGHSYTIQIYKGGVWENIEIRNPGTLISTQELINNNLMFNQENTINLETTIIIDASQELWIGYFCTNIDSVETTVKFPAGTDNGPCKDGLGNIMFYQNQWYTLRELSPSSEGNFCIKGIVQTIDGLTVNIYHNNGKIDTDIQGTTYLHNNPTGEEHCYEIEVNCLEGGVSPLSNEVCIPGVGINDNEQNAKFIIYPNPANNELQITNYELRDGIIEIYDVYGKKISSHHLIASSSHHKIDISSLSSGVYFLRLFNEQNSYMQRFIKQ